VNLEREQRREGKEKNGREIEKMGGKSRAE